MQNSGKVAIHDLLERFQKFSDLRTFFDQNTSSKESLTNLGSQRKSTEYKAIFWIIPGSLQKIHMIILKRALLK